MTSLEKFFDGIRSSAEEHAVRKGYRGEDGREPQAEAEDALGVMASHAMGEILGKMFEFKRTPKRVLAEKIAGWAWKLWLSVPEEKPKACAHPREILTKDGPMTGRVHCPDCGNDREWDAY